MTTIPDSAVAPSADPIEIAERPPGNPDAARLLRAFHGEQLHRYGFADPAELTSGEYTAPGGVFAVVYCSAVPAGCGGYRWFDQTTRTVEMKRIYIALRRERRGVPGPLAVAEAASDREKILKAGIEGEPGWAGSSAMTGRCFAVTVTAAARLIIFC